MSKEVHKTSKLLWGWVVAGIGFCASCIGIFAFVTGRESIVDVINTPFVNPNPLNTPLFTNKTSTPTINPSPTLILDTPIPTIALPTTTPMVIDSTNPGVTITIHDISSDSTSQGNVRVQFLAGNEPLRNVGITFYQATQDIADKWTLVDSATQEIKTNENGIIEAALAVGNYATYNEGFHDGNLTALNGSWGVQAFYLNYTDPQQTILFPIQAGKLTDIKVSLARIEIGIIDNSGNAVKDTLVYVYCQGLDVANKKVPMDCGDGWQNFDKTDYTGLASFNLGAGVYVIEVAAGNYYDFYDFTVQPGETRREILQIDK